LSDALDKKKLIDELEIVSRGWRSIENRDRIGGDLEAAVLAQGIVAFSTDLINKINAGEFDAKEPAE